MDSAAEEKGRDDVAATSGWGWGGWGSSAFSVLTELQKAAGEVSKSAVAAAKVAVDGLQSTLTEPDVEEEQDVDGDYVSLQSGADLDLDNSSVMLEPSVPLDEDLRKISLDKLERAGKESFLGHGLKVIDNSVESFTSGAFQALETAWKGSVNLVHKIEVSAEQLAGSIQQTSSGLTAKAGSLAPQLIETSKELTARGMHVLEFVGRETMEILATETGIELEEDGKPSEGEADDDGEAYAEEETFDRCFYIYGGPEYLEELDALSNHHTLLCNRARAKLSGEEKASFDSALKQLQQAFRVGEGKQGLSGSFKGKNVDLDSSSNRTEIKALRDASVSKAAEMAAGFAASLGGLALADILQKTSDRLEAIKTEGVHRVAEFCALCMSHLLQLGNSVLSAYTDEQGKAGQPVDGIDWPPGYTEKAKIFEAQAEAMASDIQLVSDCFVTGVGDVMAAFHAAIGSDSVVAKGDVNQDSLKEGMIEEKSAAASRELKNHSLVAVEKVQDGLKHLTYVVLWTSLKN